MSKLSSPANYSLPSRMTSELSDSKTRQYSNSESSCREVINGINSRVLNLQNPLLNCSRVQIDTNMTKPPEKTTTNNAKRVATAFVKNKNGHEVLHSRKRKPERALVDRKHIVHLPNITATPRPAPSTA